MSKYAALLVLSTLAVAGTKPRSLPLMFEANVGQAEPGTAFLGRGPGFAIHFDEAGVSLVRGRQAVRMNLRGAGAPRISGTRLQEGRANYFIGNPDQWITDVPLYEGVRYTGVYPGIDLVFFSSGGELEYDFVLAPGASAATIDLAFEGADGMRMDGGDLVLKTGSGELRHRKPRIYQMRNGRRSEIAGRFVARGTKEAGFEIDRYDAGLPLVIDPVIAYGTYIGGTGADSAWAVAVDSAGSTYVAGETSSGNFPRTFAITTQTGNGDAFLVKMNASGTGVTYATYFGGTGRDSARGVKVDSAGNAYVTGFTYSTNFPVTTGAYRSPSTGQPAVFAIKLNPAGSALAYSALIGGAGSNFATGIAIDASGDAYISGYTSSVSLPVTSGGYQRSYGRGANDAFVAKLNPSGSGLLYCTYLGGSGNDLAYGIAVDAAGDAYVAGFTDSNNFPMQNPVQAIGGWQGNAFVAELTPSGNGLVFSTYLGGSTGMTEAFAVALDSSARVYVTGATTSGDFPVSSGAFQAVNQGAWDAFVTKLSPQGASVLYSTYLGGEGSDQSSSIAVDANGVAYIAGFTSSFGFPLQNPIEPSANGAADAFAAAVGPTGSSLVWSTYLGGSAGDQATGIAVNAAGMVYVAGSTFSNDFPATPGAYRTAYAGSGDAFLVAIEISAPVPVSVSPSSGSATTQTFTFTAASGSGYPNISNVQITFSSTGASCYLNYLSTGTIYLNADSGSGWAGSGALGGSGTIQNSQCSLNLATSSASGSGNNLTLTLAITFKSGLQGQQNIFMLVGDAAGLVSSRQQMGTWTVPASAQPPHAVSVSPSSGTGASQTFGFVFSDATGASDLTAIQVMINATTSGVSACYLSIDPVRGLVSLYNDGGAVALGPIAIGATGTLQNSQCLVSGVGSALAPSGNSLTLNLAISLTTAFAGAKNVYGYAQSGAGLSSGWVALGTWTVPTASQPPQAVSVTPSSGTGSSQTFSLVYSDPYGAADLSIVLALINATLSGAGSCDLTIDPVHNYVWLLNDGATSWLGPVTPGAAGSVQNSRCTVSGPGSSLSQSGNTLTANIALTFQPGFAGTKAVYGNAISAGGLSSGWNTLGTWTVGTANQPPQAVSVGPSSGSGSSQTFSLVYSDPYGAADLSMVLALINSSLSGSAACDLTIDPVHGYVWLLNDGATSWLGPVTPGAAGTVQNSQCTVSGPGSSLGRSGNTLTANIALTFQPGFSGAKTVYSSAIAASGLSSGWIALGTWSVTTANQPPQAVSVGPSSGSGSSQTFSLVYSDPYGASDLSIVLALINSTLSGSAACDLTIDPVHGYVWLLNDGATAWLGPVTPGAAGTVQNSQCTVSGPGSSLSRSGNTLTANIALTFQPGFTGAKTVYSNAIAAGGLSSGWLALGAWTVTH